MTSEARLRELARMLASYPFLGMVVDEINRLDAENAELRKRVTRQEGYLRTKDQIIDSMGKANGRMDDTIFELRERVAELEGSGHE